MDLGGIERLREHESNRGIAAFVWRIALLVTLIIVAYWPTLDNGFVSDDQFYVVEAQELRTLSGLGDIWFELRTTPQYYPVAHTILWAEYQIWGLDPRGFHAINMLLHAVTAILLWQLLMRLAVPGAWLAAAVFAVHPVHVESVAWVSEIKNLASAAFALGSLLVYLRFAPLDAPTPGLASGQGSYLASLGLYLAAVLSKTVTATVPAVLLVLRWWKRGRLAWRDAAPLLPFIAAGLALSSITIWMERVHVGAIGPEWNLSPIERLLVASRAVWFYAAKLLWPSPLHFTYPRWRIDAQDPGQYVFLALTVFGLACLWLLRRRIGRGPLAAVLIFGGVLTPALGFFDVYPFLFSYVADHYQYHASAALIAALIAGGTIALTGVRSRRKWVPALLSAALLVPLGTLTHSHTRIFESDETLILGSLESNPNSWAAQYRVGVLQASRGELEAAIPHFREALRLFPERARLHNDIGDALVGLGRPAEAQIEYERALSGPLDDEDRYRAHVQLGTLLATQPERTADSLPHYRAALSLEPDSAPVMHNYAVAVLQTGDRAAGIALLKRAIALRPDADNSQYALGRALAESGRHEEAIPHLERGVELAPQEVGYREDLVGALLAAGQLDHAEEQARALLALARPSANAHNLMGVVLARRDELDAAIAEFRAALVLDPDHRSSATNLAQALTAREGNAE